MISHKNLRDSDFVKDVFEKSAYKYDFFNDLFSLYIHRIWKKIAINLAYLQSESKVLDIACGTCDIGLLLCKKDPTIKIIAVDPSTKMLSVAKNRVLESGFIKNFKFIQSSLINYDLNQEDCDISACFISFGLRNCQDYEVNISHLRKILPKKSKLICLEFVRYDEKKYCGKLYSIWQNFIPKIASIFSDNSSSYEYLIESINNFYNKEELIQLFQKNNFQIINSISFGVCELLIMH
jgi:demethylmenaquinone methyltransferase/2-methoxy-6-polyprenyl-1,4-benzoquinol methylase